MTEVGVSDDSLSCSRMD